jgi:glutathione S-transferase
MAPLTLHYFNQPGRAEVARLLLHTATKPVEWVDKRYDHGASWAEFKQRLPFKQLPVLELPDGALLAQSSAIFRYLACVTGAAPLNALAWARSDEIYALEEDVFQTFAHTMKMKGLDERVKARREVCAGPLKEKLEALEKHLRKLGDNAWFSGLDRPSYGDYSLFCWLSILKAGFLDGVPADIWSSSYPSIAAFHKRVGSLEGVKSWYTLDKNQDDWRQKGSVV